MSRNPFISRATVVAVSCATLLAGIFPSQTIARTQSSRMPVLTAGTGRARLSLAEPRDLVAGASKRPERPLSLVVDEFNGDGRVDVALSFAKGATGVVSVNLGGSGNGFADAREFAVPEPANFLVTGDFDGDGLTDISVAAVRGKAFHLLRGDGRGNFTLVRSVALPGQVTALTAGKAGEQGPATDLAVAVTDGPSSSALLFSKFDAEPLQIALPAEGASLAIADVDRDGLRDLAVVAGDGLVVAFGGADEVATARLDQQALSIVEGQFADGARLAILTIDGQVVTVPVTSAKNRAALSTRPLGELPGAIGLLAANVSTGDGDDLVALGGDTLRMLATEDGRAVEMTVPVAAPRAAAAAHLNGDGLEDLVTLGAVTARPRVVLTAPAATFAVTNTNDSGDGSLRKAIEDANASSGADLISFAIPGAGVHTIAPTSQLPFVRDSVTIDGYTQPGSRPNTLEVGSDAAILVEIDGSNAQAGADGSNGLFVISGGVVLRGLAVNSFGDSPDGETDHGVVFSSSPAPATDNVVAGCYIGTDATGTIAKGNANAGVAIFNSETRVGGTSPADRNVISANGRGVKIARAPGVLVTNNYIGTNRDGTADLGNADAGVNILPDTAATTVTSNTIAFNGGLGIRVDDGGANKISRNSIFANGEIGIDLDGDGPTDNDPGDADSGANDLQNFPVLTSAVVKNDALVVSGTLDSAPRTEFTVELFANDDATGGQGSRFLTSALVTTDANGAAAFEIEVFRVAEPIGAAVTATATENATRNTSEFSVPVALDAKAKRAFVCLVDDVTGDTFSIVAAEGDPEFGSWTYTIAKTGRTISSITTSATFVQPGILKALEFDGIGIRMNATISLEAATGKVKVIDVVDGVKLLTITDKTVGGDC